MNSLINRIVFLGLFILFGLQSSFAQIVNIEGKRKHLKDTINWRGSIDLGFSLVDNGSQVLNINSALRVEHFRPKSWWLLLSEYNQLKAENQDLIHDGFQHLRYNYLLSDIITLEAFGQLQFNERLNLKVRGLLGTGPRFIVMNKDQNRIYLGAAYMYEYNEEEDPRKFFNDHRISSYLSYALNFNQNFKLNGTIYYQPLLKDFNDLRLSGQLNMLLNITERLLFRTSIQNIYDSRVPETVSKNIFKWINGLKFTF